MHKLPPTSCLRPGLLLAVGLITLTTATQAEPISAEVTPPAAITRSDLPAPKLDRSSQAIQQHFRELHEADVARAAQGNVDLLFLGDSITEAWDSQPEVWNAFYGNRHAANFGIGGDQTQNVLWRLDHGALEGIAPRAIVLLIGTNNTAQHTAPQIAAGVATILKRLHEHSPAARVLLLAVFPRGPRTLRNGSPDDHERRMAIIRQLNPLLASLADGQRVRFLDLGPLFLDAAGRIPDTIMFDQLHLTNEGYRIWAEGMEPVLSEWLEP